MKSCILCAGHKHTYCGKKNTWLFRARGATFVTEELLAYFPITDLPPFLNICEDCVEAYVASLDTVRDSLEEM